MRRKLLLKKTLIYPAPTSKGTVPRWIKFLGQEAGHVGGSQKAGGCGRKFTDARKRSLQTLSNIRRSRSPSSSEGELKVVKSTQISTTGIILNLHLGEGGLPQGCLAEGAKWVWSGSDGAILDEWMWELPS